MPPPYPHPRPHVVDSAPIHYGITDGVLFVIAAALPDDWWWCPAHSMQTRKLTQAESARVVVAASAFTIEEPTMASDVLDVLGWVAAIRGPAYDACGCVEPTAPADGPHLYWLFGAGRRLLYIGMTRKPAARLRAHRRTYGELIVGVLWHRCEDVASMAEDELALIGEHQPPLNSAGIA